MVLCGVVGTRRWGKRGVWFSDCSEKHINKYLKAAIPPPPFLKKRMFFEDSHRLPNKGTPVWVLTCRSQGVPLVRASTFWFSSIYVLPRWVVCSLHYFLFMLGSFRDLMLTLMHAWYSRTIPPLPHCVIASLLQARPTKGVHTLPGTHPRERSGMTSIYTRHIFSAKSALDQ